jgi:hypothetical protein
MIKPTNISRRSRSPEDGLDLRTGIHVILAKTIE